MSISSGVALVLCLVLAANVSAASTSVSKLINTCTLSGGFYGYGKVVLKVSASEYGFSGINRIKFDAFLMEGNGSSGPWDPIDLQTATTPYFANTSANNRWEWKSAFHFGPDSATVWHRIEMYVRFQDRDGAQRLVDIKKVVSKAC